MAQIYSEQVQVDRTPQAPDTSVMTYFDNKRKASLEKVGGYVEEQYKIMVKRHAKEVQGLKDLTYKQATQVYKNMYEIYSDDPKNYKEKVAGGLKEIFDAVPDSDMKKQIMAEVQITGSGYDARVERNQIDKQERIHNAYIVDATLSMIESSQANAGLLFDALDKDSTPEERAIAAQASFDAQNIAVQGARRIKAVDKKGNRLFSHAQVAMAEDNAKNYNRYAVLNYAADNMQDNRGRVVEIYNYMKNDKKAYMEKFGLDEKSYTDTLKDLEGVVANQINPEDAMVSSRAQAEINYTMDELKIKNGKITNDGMNNLTDTISIYSKLKEAENNDYYYNNRKDLQKKKGQIAALIVDQVESGAKIKDKKFFGDNVGEVAVMQTNKNVEAVMPYLRRAGVDVNELKASMYTDSISQLQGQRSIKLSDSNPENIKIAEGVANSSLYRQLDKYVSVAIPKDKRNNPTYVHNAYIGALAKYSNDQSKAYVNNIVDTKVVNKDYGLRKDGTKKGNGYLGELKRTDGNISTEVSIGVNIDGKEMEIPTLVPGLTEDEKQRVLNDQIDDEIVNKAIAHARKRISKGLSPFAGVK